MRTRESSRSEQKGEPLAAAELQGLYGPFTFSQKLLQKIWLKGEFSRGLARTTDGVAISLIHPGRWNLLGGPDFRDARLRIGGEEVVGDVELHLHANDWAAHRHASDPAYDHVKLHVVLFPPNAGHVTVGANGQPIPVLPLLPLLLHDLEEYAAQDAVEALAKRPLSQILDTLAPMKAEALETLLHEHAAARWREKVHFARVRLQRLGWDEACHQTALEIMGYRFNRAPMLRLAAKHPLVEWSNAALAAEGFFESEGEGWSLQGLRPANHPRHRLKQYLAWVKSRPHWPGLVRELATGLPKVTSGMSTAAVRREFGFGRLRQKWIDAVSGGAVGGTRFDNLVCDGLLPLVGAAEEYSVGEIWYHWFTGDLPPVLTRALKQLAVFDGRARPACHGAAQGLLGWLIERERNASAPAGRGA